MREPRNGLRPVSTTLYGVDFEGYFHGFSQEGSLEDGIGTYATVELEDGRVMQFDAFKIKFDDIE